MAREIIVIEMWSKLWNLVAIVGLVWFSVVWCQFYSCTPVQDDSGIVSKIASSCAMPPAGLLACLVGCLPKLVAIQLEIEHKWHHGTGGSWLIVLLKFGFLYECGLQIYQLMKWNGPTLKPFSFYEQMFLCMPIVPPGTIFVISDMFIVNVFLIH